MSKGNESWGRFAAKAAMLGAVVLVAAFVGVRLAGADPGNPVRKALTVSGTLTGPMVTSNTMATFRFFRAEMGGMPLCAPVVPIRDGFERDPTTGAFSVEVPLERAGGSADQQCPGTLFHDPNAYVEVVIGGTTVVPRRPINPVPYAVYAQQYGTPDCPVGYERSPTASPSGAIVCVRRLARDAVRGDVDYVVRVGSGASAFWIDQFEASVVAQTPATPFDGSGVTLFDGEGRSGGLPANGQWWSGGLRPAQAPAYALSRAGAGPARYITWFQAQEACRASGKRLPTGEEWLTAAQGTPDPPMGNDGNAAGNRRCNTQSMAARVRPDLGTDCRSAWGAQDMIGNVSELTMEWAVAPGRGGFFTAPGSIGGDAGSFGASPWPQDASVAGWPTQGDQYRGDITGNITSAAAADPDGMIPRFGVPSVATRGGMWLQGVAAGVFYVDFNVGPTYPTGGIGFRCVIPR